MRNRAILLPILLLSVLVLLTPVLSLDSSASAAQPGTRLTLYYVLSTENRFYLVPVGVTIPQTDTPAVKALELLIRGAPPGSPAVSLIPRDTHLLGYRLENGTAFVNFSSEVTRANVGSSGEAMLLDSIIATLGQFPEVKRVQLLVAGKPLETIAGHIDITAPIEVDNDVYGRNRFRSFPDTEDHWAGGHIAALYAAGMISGFPDGRFLPQEALTRAQFVKMLVGARKYVVNGRGGGPAGAAPGSPGATPGTPVAGLPASFNDIPETAWYRTYVAEAVAAGIISPADYGGTFGGDVPITRREVAVMLVRAKGLEQEAVARRGAALPFTDTEGQPDWAKGYLAVVQREGLMLGDPGMAFRPYGRLTRAEAATVITRLMGPGGPNVFVTGPANGASVPATIEVAGVARVFEASVCVRAKQDGRVLAEAYTLASEGAPGWGFFAALLELPPEVQGDVVVEALTYSMKDGSEQDVVSRQVVRID